MNPVNKDRELFPLKDAPKVSHEDFGFTNPGSKSAWFRKALHGVGGIRLRTAKHGNMLFTCRAWMREFIDALSNPGVPVPTAPDAAAREADAALAVALA